MAKGQGWHGDSKGHAKAAKGQSKDKDKNLLDKLRSNLSNDQ